MKKSILFLAFAAFAVSCSDKNETPTPDEKEPVLATLTFEDADYKAGENYVGEESWSSLIDEAEYGGKLLYNYDDNFNGQSEYTWSDKNNTELTMPKFADTGWGASFASGGIAVSNYTLAVAEGVDYTRQLSTVDGGNNSSKNFGIACTAASLQFGNNTARVIDHIYISNTTYTSSVCLYGNSNSDALGADSYLKVTATNIDAEGKALATAEYYLAKDGKLVEGWNKWELKSLGAIETIVFDIDSDVTNEYGISLPKYFAIDDIAVVVEE